MDMSLAMGKRFTMRPNEIQYIEVDSQIHLQDSLERPSSHVGNDDACDHEISHLLIRRGEVVESDLECKWKNRHSGFLYAVVNESNSRGISNEKNNKTKYRIKNDTITKVNTIDFTKPNFSNSKKKNKEG